MELSHYCVQSKRTHFKMSRGFGSSPIPFVAETHHHVVFEKDVPILAGVPVRAATLSDLIKLCILTFDADGVIMDEFREFPRVLFLMHQHFTNSMQLATIIVFHWESANILATCKHPNCTHEKIHKCKILKYKASALQALRYWLMNYPLHFAIDDELSLFVSNFVKTLEDRKDQIFMSMYFDLAHLANYDWIRVSLYGGGGGGGVLGPPRMDTTATATMTCAPGVSHKVSLVFNHLEAEELARALTSLEHRLLRNITFAEFKTYMDNGSLEENANLESSVSLSNGLSQWIQYLILSLLSTKQRAEAIVKFVQVAKHLRSQQNFNSLMAVVGGLSHSVIARLHKTMDQVPSKERKSLVLLTNLVSSSSNFAEYRRVMEKCTGFKIPILGVVLKDFVSIHTALPSTLENGLINFRKMTQLSFIFQELHDMQNASPPFQPTEDLLTNLQQSLYVSYSEDELYELSVEREPKASTNTTGSPTNSPGDEGAGTGDQQHGNGTTGTTPPGGTSTTAVIDPAQEARALERNAAALLSSIFHVYDTQHVGHISDREFPALQSNFPSITSFAAVDIDKDGVLSKLDLETFLLAHKNLLKVHEFREKTYFRPTFCMHCSGLLWGLIRQGYQCSHCKVNSHKYCRVDILRECRETAAVPFTSTPVEPPKKRRGFRFRMKSSSQTESADYGKRGYRSGGGGATGVCGGSTSKLSSSLDQLSLTSGDSLDSDPGAGGGGAGGGSSLRRYQKDSTVTNSSGSLTGATHTTKKYRRFPSLLLGSASSLFSVPNSPNKLESSHHGGASSSLHNLFHFKATT